MRQLQRVSIVGLVAICLLGAPSSRAAIGAQLVVATSWPAAFAFDPDGRIFYGNRFTGQIRIFNPATGGDTLFFALPDVATVGEQGLLGLALHPSYPARPYIFAYYTRTVDGQPENQIVQLTDSMGTGSGFRTLLALPAAGSPQWRRHPLRARRRALRGRRRRRLSRQCAGSLLPRRQGAANLGNQQAAAGQLGVQPCLRLRLRHPQQLRLRLRPPDREPVADRERACVQRRAESHHRGRKPCLGAERDLQQRDTAPEHEPGRTLTSNPAELHLQSGHRPDWSGLLPRMRSGSGVEGRLLFGDWNRGEIHAVTLTADRLGVASQTVILDRAERHPRRGARNRRSHLLQRRKRDLPAYGPLADASAAPLARRNGASGRPRLHAPASGGRSRDGRGGRPGRHHVLRHRARLRRQREAPGARPSARQRSRHGADRDEGRHEAGRRQVDPGRTSEDDPRATAKRASPRSTASRSTSTSSTRRTPRRRGRRRCARWRGWSTTVS